MQAHFRVANPVHRPAPGGIKGAEAGMTGGTPELKVGAVDPNLPECCVQFLSSEGMLTCNRKEGHYGKHGFKSDDGKVYMAVTL